MIRGIKRVLRRFLESGPWEIQRKLPQVTLEPLELLLAIYAARAEETTILQVGAFDGSSFDPICRHLANSRSRAVLIEPNPFAFSSLQKTYAGRENITLVQAAIAPNDGEVSLYRVKRTEGKAALEDGIASFYPEHLIKHGKKASEIERISVPARSLASLMGELGLTKLDLLQIDAEGFDAEIVRMALKLPVPPACINFEHVHLKTTDRETLFPLLKAHGYLLGFDIWNLLALQPSVLSSK